MARITRCLNPCNSSMRTVGRLGGLSPTRPTSAAMTTLPVLPTANRCASNFLRVRPATSHGGEPTPSGRHYGVGSMGETLRMPQSARPSNRRSTAHLPLPVLAAIRHCDELTCGAGLLKRHVGLAVDQASGGCRHG